MRGNSNIRIGALALVIGALIVTIVVAGSLHISRAEGNVDAFGFAPICKSVLIARLGGYEKTIPLAKYVALREELEACDEQVARQKFLNDIHRAAARK